MYLDKPMRDHTLLQAIARVNRPYEVDEGEGREKRKPHGFVLDFVGIFDKLEKALAFDSDEMDAIVKDLGLLKVLFKNKMQQKAPQYLKLVTHGFNDKDVDDLIEHFRDKDRRKEFFKEFKELEMLYEIISPDAFLRPFIDDYASLAAIYAVVAKAYTKTVYVDKAFQRKTNDLVQKHVTSSPIAAVTDFVAINAETIDLIKEKHGGDDTKVINLIKSIEKTAEEESGDPFLIAMADRAKQVQESYEDRQTSTQEALDELFAEIKKNERRKREQAEKGYDSLRYFVFTSLQEAGVKNAEGVSAKVAKAFVEHPNWQQSEADLRELRKAVTFAVYAEVDDLDEVTTIVERLLGRLFSASGGGPVNRDGRRDSFEKRMKDWAARLDVRVRAVAVRKMRNKWASCSTAGRLTFDELVLSQPGELQDYVIVHELLHLHVPNHGKLWKSLMRAHLGDYESLERRLQRTSTCCDRPTPR